MSEVLRQVDPKRARVNDFLMVKGHLERITSVQVFAPVGRAPGMGRSPLCPIRDDWWAVAVHTESGATEWLGQPEFPGPR